MSEEAAYDPGEYTVDEVKEYVEDNPDEKDSVTAAEQAGKARTTLLDWLEPQEAEAPEEEEVDPSTFRSP